jgi:hypothetical protein
MDKSLRNAIIAGIIIIALSVGYYLVIFLPKKEAMRIEQQSKQKELQQVCLTEAKNKKDERFKSYCRLDNREIGSDGFCLLSKARVDYINASEKENNDLCFKKYPL